MKNKDQLLNKENWIQYLNIADDGGLTNNAKANDIVSKIKEAINYSHCCTQLPTIIEIDFDGHLKCQIETTDKEPTILKAVNGYGQPVGCNKDKIRINEI
tara:strand:+ start:829 stop:1128 length:300 start_codon:yes stop_codon:yes gene_type:complete